jgi:hypothetical protein
MVPDPIWAPTSFEIQKLAQPNVYTIWLYNKAVERENYVKAKAKALLEKKELEKQKEIEHKLRVEKLASMKAVLINQTIKPKTEIRMNNDGSICKFLY